MTSLAAGLLVAQLAWAQNSPMTVGAAQVHLQPKSSLLGTAPMPPAAPFRSPAMMKQAAPTNQWYSNAMFAAWPQPLHAHPATYRPTAAGFEIGYPRRRLEALPGRTDVVHPHEAHLRLQSSAFAFQSSRLAGRGDFSAQLELLGNPADSTALWRATLVKGSPMSYYQVGQGDLIITLPMGGERCAAAEVAHSLCLTVAGRQFAVFVPADAQILSTAAQQFQVKFSDRARRFTVALLPEAGGASAEALAANVATMARHAWAAVADTQVRWHYDAERSEVRAEYQVSVDPWEPGYTTPILGLYPHHRLRWQREAQPIVELGRYDSIRGPINTIASTKFVTVAPWQGILPFWPGLQNPEHRQALASVMVGDEARADSLFTRQLTQGSYWYGKALSATAQFMNVAEQEGQTRLRDRLLAMLIERMALWFKGEGSSYFMLDHQLGTLLAYPDEYGSVTAMNDHHFHYGYWINAAAQVALRDPAWVSPQQWGGIVDLIVRDIANTERGSPSFPFLRNFDVYEGHAWASGDAGFIDGNNQESSSEAVNAWAGLILLGEATGQTALRDLGIWLYQSEVDAINTYWLDVDRSLFPPEYDRPLAAMVFGGRYAYNTWWTEEPRQIQGINLLPITPASVYLGAKPAYAKLFFAGLERQVQAYRQRGLSDGTPADVWQDVLASYMALNDPEAALAWYRPRGNSELGDTRTRTRHWLYSLQEMGPPLFEVTANTPLYGVFQRPAGAGRATTRSYIAYNAGVQPITVKFSDGYVLNVPARSLQRQSREVQ